MPATLGTSSDQAATSRPRPRHRCVTAPSPPQDRRAKKTGRRCCRDEQSGTRSPPDRCMRRVDRGYPPNVTDARWVDDEVLLAVDGEPYAPPNPLLTAITAAARGGGLWWAISAGLAVRRGAARSAAAKGAG